VSFYCSKLYTDGKKIWKSLFWQHRIHNRLIISISIFSERERCSFLFTEFAFNYNPNLEAVASSQRLNANFMLIWQDNKLELVKYTCREHDAGDLPLRIIWLTMRSVADDVCNIGARARIQLSTGLFAARI